MTTNDVVAILLFLLGLLFGVIGWLMIHYISGIESQIKSNTRHVESLANSWGTVTMRVATMEDYLAEEHHYRPPVVIPRSDTG